ncbi:MAG TPA: PD-(D/E)XK nuclease family protein, partial [Actinomycetota bacterium]|nr:PD-(D/E)XK nuclease family protein [Actinomycetota bacterium]
PNRAMERQRHHDAQEMLRRWVSHEEELPLVAVERQFAFPFEGGRMRGKIDAIHRMGDGSLLIRDYKTGKSKPTQQEVAESLQLAAYYLAVSRDPELAELGTPSIVEYAFLFFDGDEGGFKRFSHRPGRNPAFEQETESRLVGYLDQVRSERFAPNPAAVCRFCSFKPICPLWPQGQEVRA